MSRRERVRRRQKHRGSGARAVMIAVVVFIAAVAIGALGVVGWVVDVADSAPNLSAIVPRMPHGLTRIYAADGSLLGYVHANTVFSYAPPNRIPNTLKEATVAIEDRRFWQHGALDYQGRARRDQRRFGGRDSLQGGSTLTMQLVDQHVDAPPLSATTTSSTRSCRPSSPTARGQALKVWILTLPERRSLRHRQRRDRRSASARRRRCSSTSRWKPEPRPDGDAGRSAAGPDRLQPVVSRTSRCAPRGGAPGDGPSRLHQPATGEREQAEPLQVTHNASYQRSASRTSSTTSSSS